MSFTSRAFPRFAKWNEGKSEAFPEAKAYLERALQSEPSVEVYYGLATLFYQAVNLGADYQRENLDLCRYYLEKGLALRPDYVPLIGLKVRYLIQTGLPEDALKTATAELMQNRLDRDLLDMTAIVLRQRGNYALSQAFYRYTLELFPENFYTKINYANCFFQDNQHVQAMRLLENYHHDYPEKYWGRFHLAWNLIRLGRLKEGVQMAKGLPDTLPTQILQNQIALLTGESSTFNPNERMLEAAESNCNIAFRLAEAYSLCDDPERSGFYLKKTVEKGWTTWDHFDWDPLLANLRRTDVYRQLREEGLARQQAILDEQKALLAPVIAKLGVKVK